MLHEGDSHNRENTEDGDSDLLLSKAPLQIWNRDFSNPFYISRIGLVCENYKYLLGEFDDERS